MRILFVPQLGPDKQLDLPLVAGGERLERFQLTGFCPADQFSIGELFHARFIGCQEFYFAPRRSFSTSSPTYSSNFTGFSACSQVLSSSFHFASLASLRRTTIKDGQGSW